MIECDHTSQYIQYIGDHDPHDVALEALRASIETQQGRREFHLLAVHVTAESSTTAIHAIEIMVEPQSDTKILLLQLFYKFQLIFPRFPPTNVS